LEKNLEGSGSDLIEVLIKIFLGGEENYENPQSG
jgi:hypothetical protein